MAHIGQPKSLPDCIFNSLKSVDTDSPVDYEIAEKNKCGELLRETMESHNHLKEFHSDVTFEPVSEPEK